MIGRRAVLLLLSAALAWGCGRGGGAHAPRAADSDSVPRAKELQASARPLLVDAVRTGLEANPYHRDSAPRVADSLWVRTVGSAVPGLTYHWGLFRPPGSYHVGPFTAVVGRLGDSMRVLRDEDDWWAMVRLTSWRPRAADAAAACGELGTLLGAHPMVVAYADTSSGLFPTIHPPSRDSLVRRIHPPRAVRAEGGGWDATVWMIQQQRIVRQRCHFPADARADHGLRITRPDSLEASMISF